MLALHHLRATGRPSAAGPARAPAPRQTGFSSPTEYMRFAQGMAARGSTREGIAWFLGGDG